MRQTATAPQVTGRDEWLAARTALLAREKELTRLRDEVAAARRALPWVRVEREYVFATEEGPRTLAELFGPHSQLVVQHFMFGADWTEGCPSCSFWLDGLDGVRVHLAHRDVGYVAVSRAPLDVLLAYRDRMGWGVPWASSAGTGFNADFGVSFDPGQVATTYNYAGITDPPAELPGISVFARDAAGAVHHTYSAYARGLDALNPAYQVLDLVPKGRDEQDLPFGMAWLRRHDDYPSGG